VLVDTGPLVALLSAADQHHAVCVETLQTLPTPLYTCWPVMTEALWLLRAQPTVLCGLLKSVGSLLHLLPVEDREVGHIARILEEYENLDPQIADATLVYLAERERIDAVFTLDRRGFSVYRTSRKQPFRILPEHAR